MNKDNYEHLKRFIIADHKIKKAMLEIEPPGKNDAVSFDWIVKYTNDAYDTLRYIINELKRCFAPYDSGMFSEKIDELATIWLTKFIDCKTDIDKLQKFYFNYIANMSEQVVSDTKEAFVGYSLFRSAEKPLSKCKTVNEMLHIMHSYIMNSEFILAATDVISEKVLANEYPVTLYGEENDISKMIFENFPLDLDVGYTTICSLGDMDKVFLMIRDRGHALTIEIDSSDNDILVSYFIPKLCNIDMINTLPGVIKVKLDQDPRIGTTGKFITTKDKLCTDLFSFINKVPTDDDMPIIKEYYGNSINR